MGGDQPLNGPEAALTILAATGASGLGAIGPVTWVILVLLAVLFFSYRQTSEALPWFRLRDAPLPYVSGARHRIVSD